MAFSIQQLYRRSVTFLSLALILLLILQVLVFSFFYLRNDYRRELSTQALMIAGDIDINAKNTDEYYRARLQKAAINPQLVLGCIVTSSGSVVMSDTGQTFETVPWSHDSNNSPEALCRLLAQDKLSLPFMVFARAPITDAHLPKAVGEVILLAQPPSVFTHFGLRVLTFSLLLVGFIILCLWLGQQLVKSVLKPIRQIATTAQRVTLYKDYSLRVTPGALSNVPTEIDLLIESFNAMLKEIEDRDARLIRKTVELEKSRENAEAANVAKSQFLANVSHELRTPLNAIIGFSTMLRDGQFGPLGHPKYTEYARDIHDAGRHLLDVINDILDLSRAEAGKLSVHFELLSLPKIVEKALHIVAGSAHTAKVDIYTDIPEKLPKIVADRVRLVQILLNLLSNAIKFTPEGGKVVVRASTEPGKADVHFFTIEVEDNGIGMSDEEIRKAFTNFNQAEAGLNRRFEGAGLGLPLTKRLVELHHGRLKIESAKDMGTKVTVRLTSDPGLLD